MGHDDHFVEFNLKFSLCNLLDESPVTLDIPSICHTKDKHEEQSVQLIRSTDVYERHLRDLNIYEEKLANFCGLWEDYPRHHYRMEFRIEMGQLVGYSTVHGSKALASFDGHLINMIIIHEKELGRQLDQYRGRLGWNKKYIRWEKQDSSRQTGWRSTRRWIKIE